MSRKLYVNKSQLFFKKMNSKMEVHDQIQNQMDDPPNSRIVKRMVDINFVLEQSKKRF